jgi:hypothetical protein
VRERATAGLDILGRVLGQPSDGTAVKEAIAWLLVAEWRMPSHIRAPILWRGGGDEDGFPSIQMISQPAPRSVMS